MMFTPNHTVSYRGEYYTAGHKFQIDPKDAEEMRKYGVVEDVVPRETAPVVHEPENMEDRDMLADQVARRSGRPRRS